MILVYLYIAGIILNTVNLRLKVLTKEEFFIFAFMPVVNILVGMLMFKAYSQSKSENKKPSSSHSGMSYVCQGVFQWEELTQDLRLGFIYPTGIYGLGMSPSNLTLSLI